MSLVKDVKDFGDLNDSWWDNWGAKIVKMIVKIADIVALVAGVLALLVGWIPIVGQALAAALGTIALAASLVSLLGNIALAATSNGEWSDVAWSAIGVLSFGIGRAAIGAVRVSVRGARGASRLAQAGWRRSLRPRGPQPGCRAAELEQLHGGHQVDAGHGQPDEPPRSPCRCPAGFVPSISNVGRSLRAMPGEFADDIRTLRNADWGDALSQARRGGPPGPLQFLGEHGVAADPSPLKPDPPVNVLAPLGSYELSAPGTWASIPVTEDDPGWAPDVAALLCDGAVAQAALAVRLERTHPELIADPHLLLGVWVPDRSVPEVAGLMTVDWVLPDGGRPLDRAYYRSLIDPDRRRGHTVFGRHLDEVEVPAGPALLVREVIARRDSRWFRVGDVPVPASLVVHWIDGPAGPDGSPGDGSLLVGLRAAFEPAAGATREPGFTLDLGKMAAGTVLRRVTADVA